MFHVKHPAPVSPIFITGFWHPTPLPYNFHPFSGNPFSAALQGHSPTVPRGTSRADFSHFHYWFLASHPPADRKNLTSGLENKPWLAPPVSTAWNKRKAYLHKKCPVQPITATSTAMDNMVRDLKRRLDSLSVKMTGGEGIQKRSVTLTGKNVSRETFFIKNQILLLVKLQSFD